MAHWIEARAVIDSLQAVPQPGSEGPLWNQHPLPRIYSYPGGTLVLTDLGAPAAVAALTKHYPGHHEVWNVGFAGALDTQMELGSLYPITAVDFLLPSREPAAILAHIWPSIQLQSSGARLISSAYPVHDPIEKTTWSERGYELVDMEGYAIAHLAQQLSLPCTLWKIVSDTPKKGGSTTIREWAPLLATRLATLFETTHSTKFSIAMCPQLSC